MASLNSCNFIGNLGHDPELKATPSGQSVTRFSIACAETWKDKSGEKQSRTEWVNCVVWGKQAEIADKYLKKGKQVYVEGKLQTRKYKGRDGDEKLAVEIIVDNFVMLGSNDGERKPDRSSADYEYGQGSSQGGGVDDDY